jgi:hypothetical protein
MAASRNREGVFRNCGMEIYIPPFIEAFSNFFGKNRQTTIPKSSPKINEQPPAKFFFNFYFNFVKYLRDFK